jgi:uncharacterized cupredoxin-like copper-binding protein
MSKIWYVVRMSFLVLTAYVSGENALLPSAARAEMSVGPNVVNVVAREYQYEMPDTLPSGPTLFHFTDDGKQLHHMTIVKLEQGKTLADFAALPPGPPPAWAVFMGGPNTPMPHGGQDEVVLDLSPGNYAVICVIPGPDGKPHMMKGMVKALTVTPSAQARAMPASDLTLTLTNYKFAFSTPPTAGQHAIRVFNKGTQPHEAVMFRLEAGKTGEDIANWVSGGMQGPPPGAPVAGISAMAPGKENTLLLKLSPGEYALLCFAPDAKDGKPHAAHGMIYNFKVI